MGRFYARILEEESELLEDLKKQEKLLVERREEIESDVKALEQLRMDLETYQKELWSRKETLRSSLRRHAAVLTAHPPALSRKASVIFRSPASGNESIGLTKISATRLPMQTTSTAMPHKRLLTAATILSTEGT